MPDSFEHSVEGCPLVVDEVDRHLDDARLTRPHPDCLDTREAPSDPRTVRAMRWATPRSSVSRFML